jgi:hypothetical protein
MFLRYLSIQGDRRHPMAPDVLYSNVGRACAAAGFVGVVMSYRLAPKVQHPEQVRDVASESLLELHTYMQYHSFAASKKRAGHRQLGTVSTRYCC